MPNPQRQKGDRHERDCIAQLKALGVPAVRVPLSGAAGGEFSGDLRVEVCGQTQLIECKVRKRWLGQFYGWLEGNYALMVKEDRGETLVILRLEDAAALFKGIL